MLKEILVVMFVCGVVSINGQLNSKSDMNLDDQYVMVLAAFASTSYSKQLNNGAQYIPVNITSANWQIVSGKSYLISCEIKNINCQSDDCKNLVCTFSIWERLWLRPSLTLKSSICV
jgi:hypothetical protein